MTNGKMIVRLLIAFFVVSLTFNLIAQEDAKKGKVIVRKPKSSKDRKKVEWKEKENNVVWVVTGDDLEWDTTFNIEDGENVDIHKFLKERFPEMDSSKYRMIQTSMKGKCRVLKVSHDKSPLRIFEYAMNDSIGGNLDAFSLYIDGLDSAMSDIRIIKNIVYSDGLTKDLKILKEDLGNLKYEILTSIGEADDEHTMRLKVLNNFKGKFNDYAYVFKDSDELDSFDIHRLDDFHMSIVLDSDLEKEDIDFLKKSGIKVSENKLDLNKLYLYTGEDGLFNLKFKLKTEGKATIKVITDKGGEIYSDKVQYFPGTYDKQTKISMEAKGVYYICIEQNNNSYIGKVKFE